MLTFLPITGRKPHCIVRSSLSQHKDWDKFKEQTAQLPSCSPFLTLGWKIWLELQGYSSDPISKLAFVLRCRFPSLAAKLAAFTEASSHADPLPYYCPVLKSCRAYAVCRYSSSVWDTKFSSARFAVLWKYSSLNLLRFVISHPNTYLLALAISTCRIWGHRADTHADPLCDELTTQSRSVKTFVLQLWGTCSDAIFYDMSGVCDTTILASLGNSQIFAWWHRNSIPCIYCCAKPCWMDVGVTGYAVDSPKRGILEDARMSIEMGVTSVIDALRRFLKTIFLAPHHPHAGAHRNGFSRSSSVPVFVSP